MSNLDKYNEGRRREPTNEELEAIDRENGYRKGLSDGRREDDIEQDFAYKSAEYESAYWFGFEAGRSGK